MILTTSAFKNRLLFKVAALPASKTLPGLGSVYTEMDFFKGKLMFDTIDFARKLETITRVADYYTKNPLDAYDPSHNPFASIKPPTDGEILSDVLVKELSKSCHKPANTQYVGNIMAIKSLAEQELLPLASSFYDLGFESLVYKKLQQSVSTAALKLRETSATFVRYLEALEKGKVDEFRKRLQLEANQKDDLPTQFRINPFEAEPATKKLDFIAAVEALADEVETTTDSSSSDTSSSSISQDVYRNGSSNETTPEVSEIEQDGELVSDRLTQKERNRQRARDIRSLDQNRLLTVIKFWLTVEKSDNSSAHKMLFRRVALGNTESLSELDEDTEALLLSKEAMFLEQQLTLQALVNEFKKQYPERFVSLSAKNKLDFYRLLERLMTPSPSSSVENTNNERFDHRIEAFQNNIKRLERGQLSIPRSLKDKFAGSSVNLSTMLKHVVSSLTTTENESEDSASSVAGSASKKGKDRFCFPLDEAVSQIILNLDKPEKKQRRLSRKFNRAVRTHLSGTRFGPQPPEPAVLVVSKRKIIPRKLSSVYGINRTSVFLYACSRIESVFSPKSWKKNLYAFEK